MPIPDPWKARLLVYRRLMRLDRPIGTLLLLWPTLWALWLAAEGMPDLDVLLIFCVGVVLMRSAGCVINDYADRHFDAHVERTRHRPFATGEVGEREALLLATALALVSFVLVLFTNTLTILLSVGGVILAAIYPFAKRHTYLPQVVLGAAFSWAIPMAFAAQAGELPSSVWLIYTANLLWTVAYDTFYAMVDRPDDLKIGVKSTAILFAEQDREITGFLQLLTWLTLFAVGHRFGLGHYYLISLLITAALFLYQQWLIHNRDRYECFRAFTHNNYVGAVIFAGIALDYALR